MTDATRAEQVASLLLDEIDETTRWIAELDAERASGLRRRAELTTSLQALLRTMEPAVREPLSRRLAVAAGLPGTPSRKLRGSLGDVIAFLAASETDTIRAAEVTRHIRTLGKPVRQSYGGATLTKLAATGHVERIDYGVYRINRAHPEIAASPDRRTARPWQRAGGAGYSAPAASPASPRAL